MPQIEVFAIRPLCFDFDGHFWVEFIKTCLNGEESFNVDQTVSKQEVYIKGDKLMQEWTTVKEYVCNGLVRLAPWALLV